MIKFLQRGKTSCLLILIHPHRVRWIQQHPRISEVRGLRTAFVGVYIWGKMDGKQQVTCSPWKAVQISMACPCVNNQCQSWTQLAHLPPCCIPGLSPNSRFKTRPSMSHLKPTSSFSVLIPAAGANLSPEQNEINYKLHGQDSCH